MLRKEGWRGLNSIQDSINVLIWLKDYLKEPRGRLITVTRNNTDNTSIDRRKITRKQKWEEKQLSGYFKQQTSEKTFSWENLDMAQKGEP